MQEKIRHYRWPFILAALLHALAFAGLVVLTMVSERRQLDGSLDGGMVKVSMLGPMGEPSAPSPPAPAQKIEPAPKPEEKKPEEKKPEPKPPEKKPEPTPKPQPTPDKPVIEPPKEKKPEKKEEKMAVTKPVATPAPTPKVTATPKVTVTPEKTRAAALSPADSRRLHPPKNPAVSTTTSARQNAAATSRPGVAISQKQAGGGTEVRAGSTTLKGIGLPDYYAKAALDKLSKFFRVPPEKQQEVSAMMGCRINRDGTITNIKVLTSSGSSELDEIARQALENCQRFNPFPDEFTENSVDVEIAFTFQQ